MNDSFLLLGSKYRMQIFLSLPLWFRQVWHVFHLPVSSEGFGLPRLKGFHTPHCHRLKNSSRHAQNCQSNSVYEKALPIDGETKTSAFWQTHNQGLRLLFLMVSWEFQAQRHTPDSVLDYLQFWSNERIKGWRDFANLIPTALKFQVGMFRRIASQIPFMKRHSQLTEQQKQVRFHKRTIKVCVYCCW